MDPYSYRGHFVSKVLSCKPMLLHVVSVSLVQVWNVQLMVFGAFCHAVHTASEPVLMAQLCSVCKCS